jgi:hypothetical protein
MEFIPPKDKTEIEFKFVAPSVKKEDVVLCLAQYLINDSDNCKFIFNDNIKNFSAIQGDKRNGAILDFEVRGSLSIIPISDGPIVDDSGQMISLKIKLSASDGIGSKYIRFLIKSNSSTLSTEKKDISHHTYIYDVKLNEKRNLPDNVHKIITNEYSLCKVKQCFCFHVVPNSFSVSFVNDKLLKNIRELEVSAFKKYLSQNTLGVQQMKEGQYYIIFNKDENSDSYSFFTVFSREVIGSNQIIFAIGTNIICSLLFAVSSWRRTYYSSISFWKQFPLEYWIAGVIFAILVFVLLKPHKLFSHICEKKK